MKQNKSISCLYLKLQNLKIVASWNSRGCCFFLPTSWTFGFYNKSDLLLTVKNHQLAIQIYQFNTLRLPNARYTQVGFVGVTQCVFNKRCNRTKNKMVQCKRWWDHWGVNVVDRPKLLPNYERQRVSCTSRSNVLCTRNWTDLKSELCPTESC